MKKYVLAAAFVALSVPVTAHASLVLTGNYIKVGVNDSGTLGSGGATSPGLLHDPTGTGTFGVNDYITPGTPHEGYSVTSAEGGYNQVSNSGSGGGTFGTTSPTLLAGAAALGYDNAANWTGGTALYTISNSYFFNNGDERIRVITKITALSDLTDLAFARSVDPDPDVNTFGSFATNNQRGNSLFGVDDFVGAAGPSTGLTLALVNNSGNIYVHGTMIGGSCCNNFDPNSVLAGNGINSNFADSSLNMAWRVGRLGAGNSATIDYFYAVGDKIGTVGGGAVPEPASWAMMILGFGLVGGAMRRRQKVSVTYA